MSWEITRIVKPDGTIVATARYVKSKTRSVHTSFYIEPVICPKCNEQGYLYADYHRGKNKWYGPYFRVLHLGSEHDREEYRRLRQKGVSPPLASEYATKRPFRKSCYIGRHYPRPIKRPIPEP